MPVTHVPKYPVVDPNPTMWQALYNFNAKDIVHIGTFTSAGYVFGWFGARKPFRGPQSRFLCGIGFMAGMFYATLSSTQRLMGLENNEREVQLYGALSQAEIDRIVGKANIPNIELIDGGSVSDKK